MSAADTADLTIILGNKNYSSWSLRPWLALKAAGAAFKEVVIPLNQPETAAAIRTHSPAGRVPILKHGQRTIWDSLAICEYLNELFPQAQLWPADAGARAMARAVSAEMHSGFTDLRRERPMNVRKNFPARPLDAAVAADVARIDQIWSQCREAYGTKGNGPFLFGRFSIADAMFGPVVWRFTGYTLPASATAQAYLKAMRDFPAMREWEEAAKKESWRNPAYDNLLG